eukprot:12417635-Karenia_brevis.AAC.1
MQPFQFARRLGSGRVWCICLQEGKAVAARGSIALRCNSLYHQLQCRLLISACKKKGLVAKRAQLQCSHLSLPDQWAVAASGCNSLMRCSNAPISACKKAERLHHVTAIC